MTAKKNKIGFIGQGWIGKHYANDFENRSYQVVRYSLEEPYIKNKDDLKKCKIVFIAVPTPTTKNGFSYELVEDALSNLKEETTAIIKSTILPGTTEKLQEKFPDIYVMHSPEFLREASAAYDAANPDRSIIGIPNQSNEYKKRATEVLAVLPESPYKKVMSSLEAEMVKYTGNCFLYSKVLMMNAFHDLAESMGTNWEILREAIIHDPRIGESHTQPVHDSGRGAGGHCFIKDFEAFRRFHKENVNNKHVNNMLESMIDYNNKLLIESNKNLDLLEGVYGDDFLERYNK